MFHNRLSLLFSGSGNNFDSNAAAAGFNAVPGARAFNTGGFGGPTNNFGNIASPPASTDYGRENGGTHAHAIGNSGFIGNPRNGAFVNQSGGNGNQASQCYINNLHINLGTSLSQEGNQLRSEFERRHFVPRSRLNKVAKHHR